MRRLSLGLGALATAVALAGCSTTPPSTSTTTEPAPSTSASAVLTPEAVLAANENATTVNEDEWSMDDAVEVKLSGSTATSKASGVSVKDGTVTISAAGVYRLSGKLAGQVVVDAPDDALVVLVLDGVSIHSDTTAAIAVLAADDVAVHLAEGSSNTLSDTTSYAEDADVNAALFSEEDLTISGTGSLKVTGNGNDAITSEDDLVILSGDLTVTAVDDGLRGKDSLTVKGGTISVTAGGDGFKADNEDEDTRGYIDLQAGTVTIDAGSDGMDAVTDLVMTGGKVTVTRSEEGFEAAQLLIADGTVDITATDDALNATTGTGESMQADPGAVLVISGGTVTLDAEGDGLDSNGDAWLTGGTVTVYGPTRGGNSALDTNGSLQVSGGTLVAFDIGGMTESPDADSPQGWLTAMIDGAAGDTVRVSDESGKTVAELSARKAFATVTYSAPDITPGAGYTVTSGGASTTVTAGQAVAGFGGGPGEGGPGGEPPSGGRRP